MTTPNEPEQNHPVDTGSANLSSSQQFSERTKKAAADASRYFNTTVAPAAVRGSKIASAKTKSGTATLLKSVNERSKSAQHWSIWGLVALPVLAFISIIAVFMPVATSSFFALQGAESYLNSTESEFVIIGMVLIMGFLAVGVTAVLALVSGKRGLAITSGVLGVLVGLLATGLATLMIYIIGEIPQASLGTGPIMHFVLAPLVTIAGFVSFTALSKRGDAIPEPAPEAEVHG